MKLILSGDMYLKLQICLQNSPVALTMVAVVGQFLFIGGSATISILPMTQPAKPQSVGSKIQYRTSLGVLTTNLS